MEKDVIHDSALDMSVGYRENYTYADYLKFSFEEMVEIIRGRIFKMSPAPNTYHQAISRNLCGTLFAYLKGKKCEFYNAPFDVILPVNGKTFMQSDRVVQPDIVVICNPEIVKERGCFGAPDWIIEIISTYTTKKDIQLKFDLYEESGVKEYWLVEPRNHTVEVFVLKEDKYKRITTYVGDDIAFSNTLQGLEIDLKEIFEITG
jgi:Uma2 family endonuclease